MKKFLLYFIAIILLIQIIPIKKNRDNKVSKNRLSEFANLPKNIENILDRSCNDCHSNNSNYDWYHKIAPFSWGVALHINEGKSKINFDEWGTYNKHQKEFIIDALRESVKNKEMPLASYLPFHPESVISDKDKQLILEWIKTLKSE